MSGLVIGALVLTNLLYVVGAVVVATLVSALYVLSHRKPRSMEAGIESFSKELQALAPESREQGQSRIHRDYEPVHFQRIELRPASPPTGGGSARRRSGSRSAKRIAQTSATDGLDVMAGDKSAAITPLGERLTEGGSDRAARADDGDPGESAGLGDSRTRGGQAG